MFKAACAAALLSILCLFGGCASSVPATPQATAPVFGVAYNPTTNLLYAMGDGEVSVIDGTSNSVLHTIATGGSLSSIAIDASTNTLYVANEASDSVIVISGSGNSVTTTITLGSDIVDPIQLAVNPSTHFIYAMSSSSATNDTVTVISGATNKVTGSFTVAPSSSSLAVNSTTNTIYTANGTQLNVVNGTTYALVASVPYPAGFNPSSAPVIGVNQTTNTIYVCDGPGAGSLYVFNGQTNALAATLSIGRLGTGILVDSSSNFVYVATSGSSYAVTVVNGSTNTIQGSTALGNTAASSTGDPAMGFALNSAKKILYVAEGGFGLVNIPSQ